VTKSIGCLRHRLILLGALVGLIGLTTIAPAYAHEVSGDFEGGFASGFTHPFYGWDHVAAMVAVGIWGAFLGRPAIWVLPITFPIVMALGGALAIAGVTIPLIEPGIAASSLVIGLAILMAWRAPLPLAALIVAAFAVFHGYAHGAELPHATDPTAYAVGFVLATGLLHLAGIVFGLLADRPRGVLVLRGSGGVIAVLGVGFYLGIL
jgi:urease accessory protein